MRDGYQARTTIIYSVGWDDPRAGSCPRVRARAREAEIYAFGDVANRPVRTLWISERAGLVVTECVGGDLLRDGARVRPTVRVASCTCSLVADRRSALDYQVGAAHQRSSRATA